MMKQTDHLRQRRGRGSLALALVLSLCVVGCDNLLDVNLPAQLTDEALDDPQGASVLVNSIIAHFEDAYDFHTYRTLGREEGGEVYLCGPMCNVSTYVTGYEHFVPFSRALDFANRLRTKLLDEWTAQQVPLRDRYLAITSIYEGATLGVFGMNLCEITLDGGAKQTPAQILDQADQALTRALTEIQTSGDFALQNGIATSARTLTHGLRAQVRWFKGDAAGAAADAAQVTPGFTAWVTREPGPARQNRGWTSGTGGGFFELYDVVDWWRGLPNPVTGQAWPQVLPFTGWTYLGILPDGRAVHDTGIPVRTRAGWHNAHGVAAGAVVDARVPHRTSIIQGKSTTNGEVANKFTGEGSDIALVNWKEMVLIRAEVAGGQTAIDLVNTLRAADNLPRVTYLTGATATPQQIRYMVWEERRRTLFNEARFFYTKLKNLDVFWFPRNNGGTRGQQRSLTGGVRYAMPDNEYIANTNLSTADKGTGCAAHERPVNP
jgi:hypothetical protein